MYKQIEDYDYFVNSQGNVKNKDNLVLQPALNGGGYYYVTLHKNKTKSNKMIHRLVSMAFIDNPQNKSQVNHIDGNKLNNVLENLEWVTQFENMQHSVDSGLSPKGEDSYLAKLTEKDVLAIREAYANNVSNKELSILYNVNRGAISSIVLGRTWKHVGGPIATKKVRSSLSKDDIPLIRKLFTENFSDSEIALEFNVVRGTIQQIRSGKNWKNY